MSSSSGWLGAILFLFFAITCSTQTCQTFSDPTDLMQSGSISVINSYDSQNSKIVREHVYELSINYHVPSTGFQGTGSIYDFQNSFSGQAFDFMVHIGRGKSLSTADIILLINEDNTWTKLKISYLIHSRKDFYIGNFPAINYGDDWNNLQTVRSFTFNKPKQILDRQNMASIAFICGIRITSEIKYLTFLSNWTIIDSLYTFSLNISSIRPFELIYFGYIFADTSGQSFGGYCNVSLPLTYELLDLHSISSTELGYQRCGIDFARIGCVGSGCTSTCITQRDCASKKGISTATTCFICGVGQIFRNNNCEYLISCGVNQNFNGINCICTNYHINVSGICERSCGTNAYIDKSGGCTCMPGTFCNKQKTCSKNQILVGNSCQCMMGYLLIDAACALAITCPTNTAWNSATSTCDPCGPGSPCAIQRCSSTAIWNGKTCVCTDGQYLSGADCLACPKTTVWMNGNCTCLVITLYFNNGTCQNCPSKTRWNGKTCI